MESKEGIWPQPLINFHENRHFHLAFHVRGLAGRCLNWTSTIFYQYKAAIFQNTKKTDPPNPQGKPGFLPLTLSVPDTLSYRGKSTGKTLSWLLFCVGKIIFTQCITSNLNLWAVILNQDISYAITLENKCELNEDLAPQLQGLKITQKSKQSLLYPLLPATCTSQATIMNKCQLLLQIFSFPISILRNMTPNNTPWNLSWEPL